MKVKLKYLLIIKIVRIKLINNFIRNIELHQTVILKNI